MKTPLPPMAPTDPDAPPSEEELRQAAELREALGDPSRANEDAALARALVLAHSPRPLDDAENRAMVERALGARSHVTRLSSVRARRARVGWVAAGMTTLAVAAAALLYQATAAAPVASTEPPPIPMRARPTQPLFHEPFGTHASSSHIDRIASARASDLRENMFARWDVR